MVECSMDTESEKNVAAARIFNLPRLHGLFFFVEKGQVKNVKVPFWDLSFPPLLQDSKAKPISEAQIDLSHSNGFVYWCWWVWSWWFFAWAVVS